MRQFLPLNRCSSARFFRCFLGLAAGALLLSPALARDINVASEVETEQVAAVAVKPATPDAEEANAESKAEVKQAKEKAPVKWVTAVEPKPLSENVALGLKWLVEHQNQDGGWGQGEESVQMRGGQQGKANPIRDKSNVADTCMATLALIRAGSTPTKGPHKEQINRALDFLCAEVKQSDSTSLFVTSVKGTRVQSKLGTYIDTFLAALLLSEVRNDMPDEQRRKMVIAALDKTMDKIEKNQKEDGTFDNQGWAPVLAQGLAGKAVNRAAQNGADVSEETRAKFERVAANKVDAKTGKFKVAGGAAGIELYEGAAALAQLQESANTNDALRADVEKKLQSATTGEERRDAEDQLQRFRDNGEQAEAAKDAIVARMKDKRFVAGFGNNGGEEFLSYLNIGEALVVDGGEKFAEWDKSMTENLNRVQNKDGSWSGHHCITGRTFCTSAALLTLTVDRAPVPLAAKIKNQK